MTTEQCIGVSNEGNRCKMMIKPNTASAYAQNCRNQNRDVCFMHCDCAFCSVKYKPTVNRGLKHDTVGDEYIKRYNTQMAVKRLKETKEKQTTSNSKDLSILKGYKTLEIIDNETDIDKLKCLLRAVSEDILLASYVPKAQKLHRNKDIMVKIKSMEKRQRQTFLLLENEIKKLKEDLK